MSRGNKQRLQIRLSEGAGRSTSWVKRPSTFPLLRMMLRPSFLWDRRLYGDLCRCIYAATKKFFARQFSELEEAVVRACTCGW